MITIDSIKYKPVRKHGIVIPNYYVSKCGKVWNDKSKKFITPYKNYRNNKVVDKNIDPSDPTHDPDAIGKDEIAHWEAAAIHNDWTYDDVVQELKTSAEGLQNKDRGRIFYNPNFDKEAKISAKLVDDPTETNAITPPSLTIRKLKGGVQKPSNLDGFNVKKPVTGAAL